MQRETKRIDTSEVASLLRSRRLKVGFDVSAVAQSLRIRQAYVQAMEEGCFGELPGHTYAIGFIRAYAELLGLDGEEIVRRFKAETSGVGETIDLRFPSPLSEGSSPKGPIVSVGVVFALLTYSSWYLLSSHDRNVAEPVPPVPEHLARLLPEHGSQPTAPKQELSDRTGMPEPRPEAQASAALRADGAGSEGTNTATIAGHVGNALAAEAPRRMAADAASAGPPGRVLGVDTNARIVLKATADSWVQVRDGLDNRVLLARLLRPGDVYRVPDRPGLTLLTGNAGGLDILVDGAAVPPIGGDGVVRRGIPLEAKALLNQAGVSN